MLAGVAYERIDDAGLHIRVDGAPQRARGRHDRHLRRAGAAARARASAAQRAGVAYTLIGGADVAVELDAKRAIDQGTRVALAM